MTVVFPICLAMRPESNGPFWREYRLELPKSCRSLSVGWVSKPCNPSPLSLVEVSCLGQHLDSLYCTKSSPTEDGWVCYSLPPGLPLSGPIPVALGAFTEREKKQKHAVRGRIVYSYVRRAKGERRGVTGERLAPNQRIAQHIHTQRPTNAPKKKRHRRVSYPPTSFSPSVWPEEAVTLGWGDRRGV